MKRFFTATLLLTLMLTGCARNLNSSNYVSADGSGKVLEGTIVSARPVTIKEADRLQDNGAGMLGGGALGAAAGSGVGGGSGNTTAVIGGAIVGAIAGAVIQDELGKSDGMEYIVRVKNGYESTEKQKTVKMKYVKKESVHDEIKDSIKTNMKTNLLSIVQGKDEILRKGQHVFVIYTNGRPRVTAAD